jgi:molybdate/tungstate transport system substrate-binding protein
MEQRSRRSFLGLLSGIGITGTAGCLSGGDHVSVLSAGSLAQTFEQYIGPAFESKTGTAVHGEYYGTKAVLRMVQDGTKHPDVIVSADATLLRDRLYDEYTTWDVEFATNRLGIAYAAETVFGERLDAGAPWYELVRETDPGDLAISDPDLDPLGYRAIQAFELAERTHGLEGFRDEMRELVYQEPAEPQLLSGVETGSRAGAIAYRNMAVDRDLHFLGFPDAYNFADPALRDHYRTATYTTDRGETIEGRPIIYNATVRDGADDPKSGRALVSYLSDNPGLLLKAGLTVGEQVPRFVGTVPGGISE